MRKRKREIEKDAIAAQLGKMSTEIEAMKKKNRVEEKDEDDVSSSIISHELRCFEIDFKEVMRLSISHNGGQLSKARVEEYFDFMLPMYKTCLKQAKLETVKTLASLKKVLAKTWDTVIASTRDPNMDYEKSNTRFNKMVRSWAIKNHWYESEWTYIFLRAIEYLLFRRGVPRLSPVLFVMARVASVRWEDHITMIETLGFVSNSEEKGEIDMAKVLKTGEPEKLASYLCGCGINSRSLSNSISPKVVAHISSLIPICAALPLEKRQTLLQIFAEAFLSGN